VAEFLGYYATVEASATFGNKSAEDVILKNKKNVIIRLTTKGTGVQLTAAFGGSCNFDEVVLDKVLCPGMYVMLLT